MTYSILVTEQDASHEVELCRVATNPEQIVEALRKKTLNVVLSGAYKKSSIPKYVSVRAVEQ